MKNEINVYHKGEKGGLIFGFLLIVVGVIFLGVNSGMLPAQLGKIIFSWQMLIIVIGLLHLLYRHWVSALCVTAIGVFFIIPRVHQFCPSLLPGVSDNFISLYWPVLLIGCGVLIIFKWIFSPKKSNNYTKYHASHEKSLYLKNYDSINNFEKNSIFASGEHIVLDSEFKGGGLNAVFGNLVLDLRNTSLPEGETHLEINSVFGNVTLFLPSDWLVDAQMDAVVAGRFVDYRSTVDEIDKSRKLIIHGAVVFGSAEIK